MSKTYHRSLNRNANAVNAQHRRASFFKHRNEPRGGANSRVFDDDDHFFDDEDKTFWNEDADY